MMKGHTSLSRAADGMLHYLSAHDASVGYLFSLLVLLTVILCIIPVLMAMSYAEDQHISYWLGDTVQMCCYSVPVVLFLVTLAMGTMMVIRPGRVGTRNSILIIFVVATAMLVGMGIYMLVKTFHIEADLVYDCGATPTAAELEAETQRLANFKTTCEVQMGRQQLIKQCPGYGEYFPPGGHHSYIESLEEDFECSGFCTYRAETIFTETVATSRCADALAEDLFFAGLMTSATVAVYGAIVGLTAACMLSYENI
mmetsp:Transcript_51757/g.123175  ORF Transcript_51757/g.123175 Transcript_51757/m.123175 type:complete len:255 (+) Transcript_51757:129-893(+)